MTCFFLLENLKKNSNKRRPSRSNLDVPSFEYTVNRHCHSVITELVLLHVQDKLSGQQNKESTWATT